MTKTSQRLFPTGARGVILSNPASLEVMRNWVQERAYFLWDKAGRPFSDGVEFWSKAESEYLGVLDRLTITHEAVMGKHLYAKD